MNKPAGKIAFLARGLDVDVPLEEPVAEGKPVEIVIDGVNQRCLNALREFFMNLSVDCSGVDKKLLDSLRITNAFDVGVTGVTQDGGSVEVSSGVFRTSDEIREKVLSVLRKVFECIDRAVCIATGKGLPCLRDFIVTVKPDWGCTEVMPE
jgi:hypothetical protein